MPRVIGVEMTTNRPEISNTVSGSYFRIWLFILFLLYSNFLYTFEESTLEKKFAKNLSLEDSSNLKDEKQNTAPETKSETVIDTEFTSKSVRNNEFVESDLEKFAERLGIKEFTKNKVEWKKFYGTS